LDFFSKQFVLYSAVQEGYYFISIVAILASVVSASYYLKIIKILHTTNSLENEESKSPKESNTTIFSSLENNSNIISNNSPENKTNLYPEVESTNTELTNFHSYLISLLTLSILLFILKPNLILNSTQLLSLSIFNL